MSIDAKKSDSHVLEQMNNQCATITGLEENLAILAERLGPVTRSEDMVSGDKIDDKDLVPMANNIRGNNLRLMRLNEHICFLVSVLEV